MADLQLAIQREVTLKPQAQVFSQNICLNDLVEESWLTNRCAAERNACCKWNLGGQRAKTFKKSDLARELPRIKLSSLQLSLAGSEEVAVEQTHRELKTSEVESKLLAALTLKYKDQDVVPNLSNIKIVAPVYVALTDESDWGVSLPETIGEQTSIKIISTKDKSNALGWIQASIALEGEVYVAKRTIRPNEAIKPEDFELQKANVLSARFNSQSVYRSNQFPESTLARQTILMGMPLVATAVDRVPLVRLGDNVTLILRSDNLRISTKGVVQGAAAVGDMVTVQIPRYNRTFRGRLVEGRFVEVWL